MPPCFEGLDEAAARNSKLSMVLGNHFNSVFIQSPNRLFLYCIICCVLLAVFLGGEWEILYLVSMFILSNGYWWEKGRRKDAPVGERQKDGRLVSVLIEFLGGEAVSLYPNPLPHLCLVLLGFFL